MIRRLAEEAGTVWPDIIVLLDMDSSVAARQTDPDRIGGESAGFMAAVAGAYREMAAADPRFIVVDASRPFPEVIEEVIFRVSSVRMEPSPRRWFLPAAL